MLTENLLCSKSLITLDCLFKWQRDTEIQLYRLNSCFKRQICVFLKADRLEEISMENRLIVKSINRIWNRRRNSQLRCSIIWRQRLAIHTLGTFQWCKLHCCRCVWQFFWDYQNCSTANFMSWWHNFIKRCLLQRNRLRFR